MDEKTRQNKMEKIVFFGGKLHFESVVHIHYENPYLINYRRADIRLDTMHVTFWIILPRTRFGGNDESFPGHAPRGRILSDKGAVRTHPNECPWEITKTVIPRDKVPICPRVEINFNALCRRNSTNKNDKNLLWDWCNFELFPI